MSDCLECARLWCPPATESAATPCCQCAGQPELSICWPVTFGEWPTREGLRATLRASGRRQIEPDRSTSRLLTTIIPSLRLRGPGPGPTGGPAGRGLGGAAATTARRGRFLCPIASRVRDGTYAGNRQHDWHWQPEPRSPHAAGRRPPVDDRWHAAPTAGSGARRPGPATPATSRTPSPIVTACGTPGAVTAVSRRNSRPSLPVASF